MNLDRAYILLRKLAKSEYHQSIYSKCKELNFKLVKNDIDFTELQIDYFNLLSFYSSLSTDIYLGDVDKIVLTDFIYEDAYMYYKTNKDNKDNINSSGQEINMNNKILNKKKDTYQKSQWVFKTPKRVK